MKNICVFIDLNKTNYNFKAFDDAITKLKNRGQIVYGKLYNFSSIKHNDYLDIVRKLDFEVAPENELTEGKRNKDILDIRQIVDILNFVNSKTNIDIIYLVTCDGNVVPLLKSLKIKNLYVIGSYDYNDKVNMDMCNETFDYNLFKQKPVKVVAEKKPKAKEVKKSAPKAAKKPAVKKPAAKKKTEPAKKKAPAKAAQTKKIVPVNPVKAKKPATKPKKTANVFDLSRKQGESEEDYFIRMLNAFAKRTNSLNFEFNKDVSEKKQLLTDIKKFVDEQKAIQNGKKRRNPEIMSVIRELGNLASDINATLEINDGFPDDSLKTK